MSSWAGVVTSAMAAAFLPGGPLQICDTGTVNHGSAECTMAAGQAISVTASATAGHGAVSAFIEGGAYQYAGGASATAIAMFSDSLTFWGGTGAGVVTITESVMNFGTGSLQMGAADPHARKVQITQAFSYGTPFTLTLLAVSSSSFIGSYGDGGSLLVSRVVESLRTSGVGISYTSKGGYAYNTVGSLAFIATPEPGTWVMGLLGIGLVVLAKIRWARPDDGKKK